MIEGPPQPPPESLLERGRKFLAKLRRPHTDKLRQLTIQGTTDMIGALGSPQDKVARDTLNTASEQVTKDKPQPPPPTGT